MSRPYMTEADRRRMNRGAIYSHGHAERREGPTGNLVVVESLPSPLDPEPAGIVAWSRMVSVAAAVGVGTIMVALVVLVVVLFGGCIAQKPKAVTQAAPKFGASLLFPGSGSSGGGGSVTQGTTPWVVSGAKSNNAAAPGADNIGAIGAIANAAPPSWTEGRLVLHSVDLAGSMRSVIMNSTIAVTQSGAWTLTATQGTPASTADRWPVQLTDGTDLALVSGTGALNVTCDNCGGSTFQDEDAFTVGTTPVLNTGWLVDNTTPDSAPEDSAAIPRMSANRVPFAMLRDAAGNERGANVSAANALHINLAQVAGATVTTGNGTAAGAQRVTLASDSTGAVTVSGGSVDAAQSGNWSVSSLGGSEAHDAIATGRNPLLAGGYAWAAAPADVSGDGDAVRSWHLRNGATAAQQTFAGILATTGTGATGTGTQRVDANLSLSGVAVSSGTGASGTGTVRTDSNLSLAGVAVSSGNGASGTGVVRVAQVNDGTGVLATVTNVATIGTSVTPGTSAAHLGKAEDAVHATADTGVMMLGVRNESTTQLTSAAGDYSPHAVDAYGATIVVQNHPNRFSCLVQAVTVTTQCQAAPGAGLRAYVTSVSLSNQAATVQTLDVIFGTGANCATVPTALTHKWQFGTLATTTSPYDVSHQFAQPLVPTAANAICVRPSAATAFGATITGYIAP